RGRVDLWDKRAVEELRTYNKRPLRSHVELLNLVRQVRRELPRISVPTLILHGRRDATVPPRNAALIAAAIGPSAQVRYFDRSGHAMTVDIDHEEVFTLIAEHFQAAARGRGSVLAAEAGALESNTG